MLGAIICDVFLNAAIKLFAAMMKFYVGNEIGMLCWCGNNFAVAQIIVPPVDGTNILYHM